ncbi:ORF8 [callitrichine gammaherpesvirus 3]|uniref:ORF8 n=1 Tax=callitrichine gammaherpesvirus 3 TaxID=106331 RepID=Q993K3_9GAMA|nr:ORF8 [callitrichine gammaherpesvirus 3]AAK38215.1 ORF8 [callitrichine gammaherpesvirus 3]
MGDSFPGSAHAALAKRSRSLSLRHSFRISRREEHPETTFTRGMWKYELYKSHVKITNKQVLELDATCQELPPCPSVGQIIRYQFPAFNFNSATYGSRYFTCAFVIFGDTENEVYLKPVFVLNSEQEVELQVLNPRNLYIDKGKFIWYMVPLRLVKTPYLYLRIFPNKGNINLETSCSQWGDKLSTNEPQIFLSGVPVSTQDESLPFLLAQRTRPFSKPFARIHTFPGKVCPVNALRLDKTCVRVSVDVPTEKPKAREEPIKIGMTLLNDVILAFKYNPYPKSTWRWDGESTEIRYFGSPVIIPPNFITSVDYNNTYETPLSTKITALILSHPNNQVFYIYPQEWKPGQTIKLMVRNISNFPITIITGQPLAQAFFIYNSGEGLSTMMKRAVHRHQHVLTLPGNIMAVIGCLPTFERINKSCNGNMVNDASSFSHNKNNLQYLVVVLFFTHLETGEGRNWGLIGRDSGFKIKIAKI